MNVIGIFWQATQRELNHIDSTAPLIIFTTWKLSLGQGNIFTPVCHSVHGGMCGEGVCMAGGNAWQGVCMAGGHAWQGVCMAGGGHVWQGGCAWQGVYIAGDMHGRAPQDTMRYGRSMREWYASLLECILVGKVVHIFVQLLVNMNVN